MTDIKEPSDTWTQSDASRSDQPMHQATTMLILRMAFLAPAIADFGLASLTVYRMIGVADESLVPRGQFAGAAFCWGLLLLLGLAKPVERAWVLQPTAMVIGCIALAVSLGFVAGNVPISRLAVALMLSGTMIWLCWAGLRQAAACRDPKAFDG